MFSNLFGSIAASLFADVSIGGISLGSLGRTVGKVTGNYLDDNLDDNLAKIRKNILSPLDLDKVITTSDNTDDTVPLLYGTVRVGGKIIWNSMMEQKINSDHLFSGKWGIMPTRSPDRYNYSMSIAVALCEGEIDRVTNIYLNDRMLSTDIVTRIYKGADTQTHDPLIAAFYGHNIPNFKHTAYVVIENIPIELYNKNLPNVTFDVVKGSEPKIEDSIKAVCMIPASGEFVYATDLVQRDAEFSPIYENVHTPAYESDFSVTVKNLKNTYKNLKNVSLVVGWFFDHTDPAVLNILPAVETRNKITTPLIWSVAGYTRQTAWLVSNYNNSPAYGGTPCDEAVKQGIIKLFQAGYKVTFYPFLFGDIVPNNPQNQPAYPWRGRIKPVGDSTQKQNAINRFFASDSNGAGYNQMITHYANLCKQVNDIYPNAVDLFIIGSELRGLTQTKVGTSFPAVEKLRTLASTVRAILGTGVKLTYAADWSEGGGYNDTLKSLDFPMDRLWASSNIDYVAYDWYAPLTDWRDGDNHLDKQLAENDKDINYLKSRIEGGEGYEWYYATETDRNNQIRTPITDGQYNKPWVFRIKDIRNRWLNTHIRRTSTGFEFTPATSWIPQSKKIIFTEVGCPAVNKGGNSPNLFPDVKSSENGIPPYSNGLRDDFIQRAVLKAFLDYWANDTNMIDTDRTAVWCVDARPYPAFPARADIWGDSYLYRTGHWIDGRGGFSDLKTIISDICNRADVLVAFESFENITIDGFIINKQMSAQDILNYLIDLFDLQITQRGNVIEYHP
jgi:GTA TIM-barrel-like domain